MINKRIKLIVLLSILLYQFSWSKDTNYSTSFKIAPSWAVVDLYNWQTIPYETQGNTLGLFLSVQTDKEKTVSFWNLNVNYLTTSAQVLGVTSTEDLSTYGFIGALEYTKLWRLSKKEKKWEILAGGVTSINGTVSNSADVILVNPYISVWWSFGIATYLEYQPLEWLTLSNKTSFSPFTMGFYPNYNGTLTSFKDDFVASTIPTSYMINNLLSAECKVTFKQKRIYTFFVHWQYDYQYSNVKENERKLNANGIAIGIKGRLSFWSEE